MYYTYMYLQTICFVFANFNLLNLTIAFPFALPWNAMGAQTSKILLLQTKLFQTSTEISSPSPYRSNILQIFAIFLWIYFFKKRGSVTIKVYDKGLIF